MKLLKYGLARKGFNYIFYVHEAIFIPQKVECQYHIMKFFYFCGIC